MPNEIQEKEYMEYSPCLAVIEILQRTIDVAVVSFEEQFNDPWNRTIGKDEIPGSEVRKALLYMAGLMVQLRLIRQKMEYLADEDSFPS